jgi:drug/metabolite transporter (DMT)-like permease
LLYTYPVFVAIGGWIFLQERIPKSRWFVIPTALLGMVLLIWGEFYIKNPWSLVLGIAAAAFYAVYILCSRKYLEGVDPLPSVALMQVSAGTILAALNCHDPVRVLQVIHLAWLPLIGLAIVCSIGAMSFFLAGLQKLKGWEASILGTAEPVTSILIAFCLLNERLSFTQFCGAGLVLVAFIFVSLPTPAAAAEKIYVNQ